MFYIYIIISFFDCIFFLTLSFFLSWKFFTITSFSFHTFIFNLFCRATEPFTSLFHRSLTLVQFLTLDQSLTLNLDQSLTLNRSLIIKRRYMRWCELRPEVLTLIHTTHTMKLIIILTYFYGREYRVWE